MILAGMMMGRHLFSGKAEFLTQKRYSKFQITKNKFQTEGRSRLPYSQAVRRLFQPVRPLRKIVLL